MQSLDQPTHRIADATSPLWLGSGPAGWGEVVRAVNPDASHSAASMIAAAGLDWVVEQHPGHDWLRPRSAMLRWAPELEHRKAH